MVGGATVQIVVETVKPETAKPSGQGVSMKVVINRIQAQRQAVPGRSAVWAEVSDSGNA